MSLYRKKPVIVQAITFEELVEIGRTSGNILYKGHILEFEYYGHVVTYLDATCYLIPTPEGIMKCTPEDMLITGVKGEIYPCKKDIFQETYEEVR